MEESEAESLDYLALDGSFWGVTCAKRLFPWFGKFVFYVFEKEEL
jgi:hypothetical protein